MYCIYLVYNMCLCVPNCCYLGYITCITTMHWCQYTTGKSTVSQWFCVLLQYMYIEYEGQLPALNNWHATVMITYKLLLLQRLLQRHAPRQRPLAQPLNGKGLTEASEINILA